jgi:protein involved in polysaccharide export with SLBB domain
MKTRLLSIVAICVLAPATKAGPPESIILIGEIRSPGIIAYSKDLTLVTTILNAGGFADWGSIPIYLIRNGAVISHPNIRRILEDAKTDIPLKPWDIISVGNFHRREASLK